MASKSNSPTPILQPSTVKGCEGLMSCVSPNCSWFSRLVPYWPCTSPHGFFLSRGLAWINKYFLQGKGHCCSAEHLCRVSAPNGKDVKVLSCCTPISFLGEFNSSFILQHTQNTLVTNRKQHGRMHSFLLMFLFFLFTPDVGPFPVPFPLLPWTLEDEQLGFLS